jgi:hypothetical protein
VQLRLGVHIENTEATGSLSVPGLDLSPNPRDEVIISLLRVRPEHHRSLALVALERERVDLRGVELPGIVFLSVEAGALADYLLARGAHTLEGELKPDNAIEL